MQALSGAFKTKAIRNEQYVSRDHGSDEKQGFYNRK
jgi:hypothetical protein